MVRMDESDDARRILTAVPQSDWKRPAECPHTSWLATMKNDLSSHPQTQCGQALWKLLAVSEATHRNGAR